MNQQKIRKTYTMRLNFSNLSIKRLY